MISTALSCKIKHAHLVDFAEKRVNLRQADVVEERAQVDRLRDRLAEHIRVHPDVALVKMRNAGSLAKGTALRTINDVDLAVYLRSDMVPNATPDLIKVVADILRQSDLRVKPEQIVPKQHCVTISYRGTGLDIDVVPVLYKGGPGDTGYLITKDTGDYVLTNVTQHIDFVRKRKKAFPKHFRQIIRFMKWWSRQQKLADEGFRCKSFMLELIVAHLFDGGLDGSDYPAALTAVFAYFIKTGLRERIVFTDYYKVGAALNENAPIRIYDPVNPNNNIVARYSDSDRKRIVEAAQDAFDAITYAQFATTKGTAIEQWRSVFGPSFGAA